MRRLLFLFLCAGALLLLLPSRSPGRPEYSERTGQGCLTCHETALGGRLTREGLQYAASGYTWPPEGGYRVLGPIRRPLRLAVGYVHIVSSFVWFGAILYVHILLRPAYASKGLPRGEMLTGLVSMLLVGLTGILLTISKIRGWDVLAGTHWGQTLLAKMVLYVIMVSTALLVVAVVGPRLRRLASRAPGVPENGVFGPDELLPFDGKEGRKAYIAHKGKVMDVTGRKLWRGGLHMKHLAGMDLTEALGRAPHGEEKLEGLPVVGSFHSERKRPLAPEQKAFYVIAYLNLFLVFLVLLVIALWRWWI
jgi:predicted heme/steroid binding protein